MLRAALLALCLVTLALAPPASAQSASDVLRPCKRADVLGLWEVVRLGLVPASSVDRAAPAYAHRYQRYVFRTNATMLHATSERAFTVPEQRALLTAAATTTWAIDVDGRLLLHADGTPRVTALTCRVLVQEVTDPRGSAPGLAGDLLLTEFDDGRPVARRMLRKLRLPEAT